MAKSEAKSAFNNDAVFIERFIQARHIEIQFLVIKKCYTSLRENVQFKEDIKKLLKKHLHLVLVKNQELMGKIAVKLAKKVSYSGAGTVEFIMDQKKIFIS